MATTEARSRKYGTLELLPASRLTVIARFQRVPKPPRVRELAKLWDDRKVGCLHVAHITDGQYKGRYHVVNGGTRWAVMVGLNGTDGLDPEYVFPCYVEKMTWVEAADAFLAENDESMKPSAFVRYKVGTAANKPWALAVQTALKNHGLIADEGRSVYGDADNPGMISALAACNRIVHRAYGRSDNWKLASLHLTWVLGITRRAYPAFGEQGAANAHDADIIQAVSVIGLNNQEIMGDEQKEADLILAMTTFYFTSGGNDPSGGLFEDRQPLRPAHWRTAYAREKRGSTGGSESRGGTIAKLIVQNLHRHVGYRLEF